MTIMICVYVYVYVFHHGVVLHRQEFWIIVPLLKCQQKIMVPVVTMRWHQSLYASIIDVIYLSNHWSYHNVFSIFRNIFTFTRRGILQNDVNWQQGVEDIINSILTLFKVINWFIEQNTYLNYRQLTQRGCFTNLMVQETSLCILDSWELFY